MNHAIKKRYVPASQRFDDRPKLKTMRRDEFTLEEYRHLHTVARSWVKQAIRPSSTWYRTVAYNFILIMCNTGKGLADFRPIALGFRRPVIAPEYASQERGLERRLRPVHPPVGV